MSDEQIFWSIVLGVAMAGGLLFALGYLFYVLSIDWDSLDVPMEHYSPWENTPGEIARDRLLEDSKYD